MPNDGDRRSGAERRGGDALLNEWLFQEFRALRDLVTDQHASLRSEMFSGFAGVRGELRKHEDDDRAVERRLHDMEIREDTANKAILKRHITASGAVAAIVGPTTAYLFRKWFG